MDQTSGWMWDESDKNSNKGINEGLNDPIKNYPRPSKDDRLITSPSANYLISDYWEDCFESVFINFNTFYIPQLPWFKTNDEFYSAFDHEKDNYCENLKHCIPVKWKTVIEMLEFKTYNELMDALNNRYLSNLDFRIDNFIYPQHRNFSPSTILTILCALHNIGYNEIYLGNEFADKESESLIKISDIMKTDNLDFLCNGLLTNAYPNDRKWLITAPYDSCCTFICGPKDMVDKIVIENDLEGFYALTDTRFWWSDPNRFSANFSDF